jgi:hypothetical protein
MIQRLLTTLLIALAATVSLHAQGFSGDVLVSDDTTGARQGSPQIQVGPDGRLYVVWVDFRSGDGEIAMSTSGDDGRTWSATRIVLPGRSALAGMQRGAQFAIDRRGGIHLVFQERNPLGHLSAMYSRSTDGGATFSTPIYAASDDGRYDQDFPSIAVDSSDGVAIAWIDNREIELGTSQNTQLYFARSSDRGVTFGAPIRASRMPGGAGGSCECCNTSIAISNDGAIYIAFRGNIDNARDVHVARSVDVGRSFEVFRAASSSWMIAACPMTGSSLVVDRFGTAHVVWRDSRQSAGGRDIIYFASLGRRDTACTLDARISDSPKRTNYPSMIVTPAGELVVAWQDTRDDANDIRYTWSVDGGNSFVTSAKLTGETGAGRQEVVSLAVAPGGTRFAAWQDCRRDEGDIVVARDTTTASLVAPAAVRAIAPVDGATVVPAVALEWSAPGNLGDAREVIYDVAYARGADTATVIAGLRSRTLTLPVAAGTYQWRVRARTSVAEVWSAPFTFTVVASASAPDRIEREPMLLEPAPAEGASGSTLRLDLVAPSRVAIASIAAAAAKAQAMSGVRSG